MPSDKWIADETEKFVRNIYWISDSLLAGAYPGHSSYKVALSKLDALMNKKGVVHFVDLTTPADFLSPYDGWLRNVLARKNDTFALDGLDCYTYRNFEMAEGQVPSDPESMKEILDELDKLTETGKRVYLHCAGGEERTHLVLGCYLIQNGFSGDLAMHQLGEWHKGMTRHWRLQLNDEQKEYVLNWKVI